MAVRIPVAQGLNKRLEHRIAGADANPYLVLSAILQGILHGIGNELEPPPPVEGNGYEAAGPQLAADWAGALQCFLGGRLFAPVFGSLFTRVYSAVKRQELDVSAARITDFEYDTYLRTF